MEEKKTVEVDKYFYENEDVVVKQPGDIRAIEGYSGAFCQCGHTLHIKTPKRKMFHAIKCPICNFIVNLYCGEEGPLATTDSIRQVLVGN